jgi:tetratricopeptide (TPR) repeat protein
VLLGALFASCANREEAVRSAAAPPAPPGREDVYREGHRLLQAGEFDSAAVVLEQARAMDSLYRPPLQDLALLKYDRALRSPEGSTARTTAARSALAYYAALERLGQQDEETYERLTEMARLAGDGEAFLRYAQAGARRHPSDRRVYNLALALTEASKYKEATDVLNTGIRSYPVSGFQGGFHRLLGNAYLRMDRDQSAERTFTEGVKIVDRMLEEMERSDPEALAGGDGSRMREDRTSMLRSLKKLHQTYGRKKELGEVEQRLRAEGGGR